MTYPRWASRVLLLMAIALVPWTAYIAWTLPRRQVVHHWDLAWGGFDAALVVMLAVAGVSFARGRPLARTLAPVIATLLVCDAWFDVVTAGDDSQLWLALGLAVFAELPIAAFCLWLTAGAHREGA
jgi:hypothetical protein